MAQVPTANAETILKTLDGMFIGPYIGQLNKAKYFMQSYLSEIAEVEKRLAKVDSSSLRKSLGEDSLTARKAAIQDTLAKLEAHQAATLKRLLKTNG